MSNYTAYQPKTWASREFITRTALNHMEDGISNASDEIISLGETIGNLGEVVTEAEELSTALQSKIDSADEVNNSIASMIANIPADYSNLIETIAPNYSDLTFPIKIGEYCWNNGNLYKAKINIASSETWTAGHWESVVVTSDIGELRGTVQKITVSGNNLFDSTIEAKKGYLSPIEALNASTLVPSTNETGSIAYALIMKAIPVIGGHKYAFPAGFVGRLTIFLATAYNGTYALQSYATESSMTSADDCLIWTAPSNAGYIAMHIWKIGGITQDDLDAFMIIEVDDAETFEWPSAYIPHGRYVPVDAIKDYDVKGKDAENASAISAINTATSTDVGKFLKVKTVSNGKVTEWEFGAGSNVVIDDTAGEGDTDKVWSADKSKSEVDGVLETIISGGVIHVPITKNVDFSNSSDGYINASGSLVGETQSTYVHSQPFAIKSGERIDIKVRGYNQSGTILAVLAKVITNGYQSLVNSIEGTITAEDYTYTATEDCTVIISYRADTTHTAVITGTENIDISQQIMKKSHFVKRDDDSVYIKSHYNDDEDIVVQIALDGGNDLPNPKSIFTVTKSSEIMDDVITPSRYLLNRYTDWFSPHYVAAVNNIDGSNPNTQIFTGGNHQSNNSSSGGVPTAECTQFDVYCDGVLVEDGDSVYGDAIQINITNEICGYNTWKSDGTGRKILKEQIRITMGESARMNCEIIHTALENIVRARYYGLQTVNDYYTTGVQYLGGTNRGLYATNAANNCGNKTCRDGRFMTSAGDIMLTHVDNIDLGSFDYAPGTDNSYFTTTAQKSYFSILFYTTSGLSMDSGDQTCVRGWYDWVFSEPASEN